MLKRLAVFSLFILLINSILLADEVGSASGKGIIERFLPNDQSEMVPFTPKYSVAYTEPSKTTWIVLSEINPPVKEWLQSKDPSEARRLWCEKEKASFVALKLDNKWAVDLYFLCPGNGFVNTEMLSTINGLDSIAVKFEERSDSKLKGTLKTGEGNCPTEDGKDAYCTEKGKFSFEAPLLNYIK